jgi:2'-5' RNA ligase
MSSLAQESALLIRVPAAEPAVAPHRSRLDSSAPLGVPAHITVLYPFLPPPDVDADVLASLSRLFASVDRFRFTLDRAAWFGDDHDGRVSAGVVVPPG